MASEAANESAPPILGVLVVIIALAGAAAGIASEGLLDKQLGIAAILTKSGIINEGSVLEEASSSVLGAISGAAFVSLMAFVAYKILVYLHK